MTRGWRTLVLLLGAGGLLVMVALAALGAPTVGGSEHPYRDRAVQAALRHDTANVVSSVNYDQRALDTFGEELILLTAVSGATVLLRPAGKEQQRRARDVAPPLDATALAGYVLLPVTLLLGLDVVAHGAVTPGGGFQGGVVLATGLHLLYVSGSYRALETVRPVPLFEHAEAAGAAAYTALGVAGVLVAAGFLANLLPTGQLGSLLSAGSVPLLSAAVGVEVAGSVVVLLARFLEQALVLSPASEGPR
ncbi:MAG: MnhB domain-containing protein [Motilibacteraceae bacterium]